jgi:transcriptional regulator with XRE-family HTH domain
MKTMGTRLSELRNQYGLTLDDVASRIKINKGSLSRIENDKNEPSINSLVALSQLFGVTTDWILFGDNKKEESLSVSPLAKDKKITRYFQYISKLWIEGNRDKKGWIITQLERAFPEVAEEMKIENEK